MLKKDSYQLMVEEIEDYAILLLDKNGNVMNWNKGAQKIKGYVPEEIIGKNFELFYTTEDRENKTPEKLLKKATTNGKATDEGWRVRKDGTRFWGSILITALHDKDNNITGFSKVTRDLTGKKDAEELEKSLGQTKEGLLKMFNASPSGMIMIDMESRMYVDVNKNFLTTFGYTRDEVVGLTLADMSIVTAETREKLFGKLKQQGYFKNEEVLGHSKDGKEIATLVSADSFEMNGKKYILYVIQDISAIKDLERKVLESDEKFKKMFQSISAGITITRLSDSRYLDVNDAFVQITGYSKEELIGHSSVELGIIVNIEKRDEVLRQIRDYNSIKHFEATIRHKSGKTLYILSSIDTILLDKEKYAINVIYDITERKKAEETEKELVQTKEGLMKMFNASPSGMIIADTESGKMLEINNSFITAFGYSREEAIGQTADELGFVSNATQVKSFGKLQTQGYLKNEDVPCITKTGRQIDTIFSVELFEMDGKKCFLCIMHDISQIKTMERKLIESENKYRNIIEEAGDVLYSADAHGTFTYINKRVKLLTGYTDEELIGKHFSMIIAPEWQEKIRQNYREQFKHKVHESVMEFTICTKGGHEKWVEQVVIMQIESGFIKGFQCIVRDITERKKANQLLAEQKQQIEKKNKDIIDSINYAKRIQDAIFPPEDLVKELLPKSFVLFKPKDIISGDFYWIEKFDNKTFIAAVDCTGHGVPGALLSIIGYNILSKSINEHEHTHPNKILDELSKGINQTLRHDNEKSEVQDSMDIALCSIDRTTNILEFAGAYNSLYIIRNNAIIEMPPNRFPIGVYINSELQKFTNQQMQLEKGDMIYLFSDGYADQFGGPKGKKMMRKGFKDALLSVQHLNVNEQKKALDTILEEWKWMTEDQTDDILVIGIQI